MDTLLDIWEEKLGSMDMGSVYVEFDIPSNCISQGEKRTA